MRRSDLIRVGAIVMLAIAGFLSSYAILAIWPDPYDRNASGAVSATGSSIAPRIRPGPTGRTAKPGSTYGRDRILEECRGISDQWRRNMDVV